MASDKHTLLPFPNPNPPPRGVQLNWYNYLDELRYEGEPPYQPPTIVTDDEDVNDVADHLQNVLNATVKYARAVIGDLQYRATQRIPNNVQWLADATSDLLVDLRCVASRLAQQSWED